MKNQDTMRSSTEDTKRAEEHNKPQSDSGTESYADSMTKATMVPNGVAASTPTGRRLRPLLGAGICLAVLVVGTIVVWRLQETPKQPVARPLPAPARAAYAKGDYAAAAAALEKEGRTDLEGRLELAVAYENAKDYDKALAIYAEQDKDGKLTASYTFRAGEVAFAKKDMTTAKRYYELAKERYKEEGGHRIQAKVQRCDDRLAEIAKAGA